MIRNLTLKLILQGIFCFFVSLIFVFSTVYDNMYEKVYSTFNSSSEKVTDKSKRLIIESVETGWVLDGKLAKKNHEHLKVALTQTNSLKNVLVLDKDKNILFEAIKNSESIKPFFIPIELDKTIIGYFRVDFDKYVFEYQVWSKMLEITLYFALGLILFVFLMTLSIFINFRNPIKLFLDSIRAIQSTNNLSLRVKLESKNEIGLLADAFNGLMDWIEQAYNLLKSSELAHSQQYQDLLQKFTNLSTQSQSITQKLTTQPIPQPETTVLAVQDNNLPEATRTTLTQIHQSVATLQHSLNTSETAIDEMNTGLENVGTNISEISATLQSQQTESTCDTFSRELTTTTSTLDYIKGIEEQTETIQSRALPRLKADLAHYKSLLHPDHHPPPKKKNRRKDVDEAHHLPYKTPLLSFKPGDEIKVLIFDDHLGANFIFQSSLAPPDMIAEKFHYQSMFKFKFLEQQESVDNIIEKVEKFKPDLVLLDLCVPCYTDGFDALTKLHQHNPNLPIIMISQKVNPVWIAKSYSLGARSYLPKRINDSFVPMHLDMVLTNNLSMAGIGAVNYLSFNKIKKKLTDSMLEILALMIEGYDKKEIGEILDKSSKTVDKQQVQMRDRLGGLSNDEILANFLDTNPYSMVVG